MVRRLSAVDAQMHWMSAKIPNDQFLLYGFAGVPSDLEQALARVRARAAGCPELRLRVRDQGPLTYPSWIAGEVGPDQVLLRDLTDSSWAGCLAAVARLAEDQLDARLMTWRLHVFTPVDGLPGAGVGTVAVLQATHALETASGRRRWRHGCSAARGRCHRCRLHRRFAARRCRGAASWLGARIDSWSATPMQDWFPRRRIRARCFTAMCAPTGCAASAR